MKLSTKGRYAVMAMVDLARHAQAKPVSLSDMSRSMRGASGGCNDAQIWLVASAVTRGGRSSRSRLWRPGPGRSSESLDAPTARWRRSDGMPAPS